MSVRVVKVNDGIAEGYTVSMTNTLGDIIWRAYFSIVRTSAFVRDPTTEQIILDIALPHHSIGAYGHHVEGAHLLSLMNSCTWACREQFPSMVWMFYDVKLHASCMGRTRSYRLLSAGACSITEIDATLTTETLFLYQWATRNFQIFSKVRLLHGLQHALHLCASSELPTVALIIKAMLRTRR